jgi:hypothetical protein
MHTIERWTNGCVTSARSTSDMGPVVTGAARERVIDAVIPTAI